MTNFFSSSAQDPADRETVPSADATDGREWAFWILAVALVLLYAVPKVLMHEAGFTTDLDTGNYSNQAWGLVHGQGFFGSVLGRHHLGEHFSPAYALFSPFYLIYPSANVILLGQGISAGLAVVICVWLLDRFLIDRGVSGERLGRSAYYWRLGAVVLFLVLGVLYKAFAVPWAFQFQPIVLGMAPLAAAVAAMHLGRWRLDRGDRRGYRRANIWLAVWVVLLLCTRESATLSVIGLGIYAVLVLRRWKLAILLMAAAGVTALLVFKVVMPYFREADEWNHGRRLGLWRKWDLKSEYLWMLVVPLGLLPLIGWRALATTLAALPSVGLNVSVSYEYQFNMTAHYDAQLAVFFLLATTHGISSATRFISGGASGRIPTLWRPVLGAGLAILVVWPAVTFRGVTPFERIDQWWPTAERRAFVREARELGERFADVPLAADKHIGPQVAHRPGYKTLRSYQIPTFEVGQIILATPPGAADAGERARAEWVGQLEPVVVGEHVAAYRWLGMKPPEVLEVLKLSERAAKEKRRLAALRKRAAAGDSEAARHIPGQERKVEDLTSRFRQGRQKLVDQGVDPALIR